MTELDPIVAEAQKRFDICNSWESEFRSRFVADRKFVNADSDNLYQWEETIHRERVSDDKPCLTVNKTRQHCLQVINDARQNKPGVKVRATGGGASMASAKAIDGIIRYIEYHSNAQAAYDLATVFQVEGGVGYWRVETDYVNDTSFDQDIFIRPIADPLTVFIDPNAKEPDKSDMNYAIIFEDLETEEVKRRYPKYKGETLALGTNNWIQEDKTRVAEYFRRVEKKDKLVLLPGSEPVLLSSLPKELREEVLEHPQAKVRETMKVTIEWFLIAGHEIMERREWPGKYIPVVALIGEETVIEGKMDRKGHTRALKDPQRMYNYWSSAAVEYGALQSKTPYIGPAAAFESFEHFWKNANRRNYPYLPYNAYDDNGLQLVPPARQEPPMAAPVALTGMEVAANELMLVSGQYEAELGQQGNERTGRAINAKQRQGDNATYHYIDHLGIAIKYTGKIILDLIPKIYDTRRVVMILAEDGTSAELRIDPNAAQAYQERLDDNNEVAQRILNPNIGQYQVRADIGPAYSTKRQESFEAFTLLLTQNPGLTQIIGDIMLRAGDFPLADEAAERLKRMVPREALGQGPTQQEQALQQQLEQMNTVVAALMDEISKLNAKSARQEDKGKVEVYNALTQRLKVMGSQALDDGKQRMEVVRLIQELLTPGGQGAATEGSLPKGAEEQPPIQGARKAPDGQWYLPDSTRPGKYLRVRAN